MNQAHPSPATALPSRPTRLTPDRAEALLDDWRASGLSQRAFARQRGLHVTTISRWLNRPRRLANGAAARSPRLARVELVADVPPTAGRVYVVPGNPPQVVLPEEWDAACLRRVVEACRC